MQHFCISAGHACISIVCHLCPHTVGFSFNLISPSLFPFSSDSFPLSWCSFGWSAWYDAMLQYGAFAWMALLGTNALVHISHILNRCYVQEIVFYKFRSKMTLLLSTSNLQPLPWEHEIERSGMFLDENGVALEYLTKTDWSSKLLYFKPGRARRYLSVVFKEVPESGMNLQTKFANEKTYRRRCCFHNHLTSLWVRPSKSDTTVFCGLLEWQSTVQHED